MDINAAFPGAYLKASDLKGKHVSITMDRVEMKEVGDGLKPVLYFVGKEIGFVLNKTNGSIISEMYGPETDDWHGKTVKLYPARVEFQGKIVDAIRVQLVDPKAVSQEPLAQAQAPAMRPATPRTTPVNNAAKPSIADDEIPF